LHCKLKFWALAALPQHSAERLRLSGSTLLKMKKRLRLDSEAQAHEILKGV
jgi:hypothetical protein